MVGASQSVRDRLLIGENTGGVSQFSSACGYYLPNSKFVANIPRHFVLIPGFEECVGFLPDYWLDSMEPVQEVLRWLNDPDNYQFTYSCKYDDMLKHLGLGASLPADVKIVVPGLTVPESLRVYSGKWFGISDGMLDHLLVVEKIESNSDVSAIYSWGVAYQWNINEPGWRRFKGRFEHNQLILADDKKGLKITYEYTSDGTLAATYERPGVFNQTELTKISR